MPRKLKRPPIIEAIFTITFSEVLPKERLDLFLEANYVKEYFPLVNRGVSLQIDTQVKNSNIVTTQSFDGYTLRPPDGKNRLIQIKPDMLSFHNFSSYDGWDTMIKELRELWSEFCKSVGKSLLKDVQVRNINSISLPLPFKEGFQEYLTLLPSIPPEINSSVGNFFIQIQTAKPGTSQKAVITEAIVAHDVNQRYVGIMLDIAVKITEPLECNTELMWKAFDDLREFKDEIFFAAVTEKTIELFNHE